MTFRFPAGRGSALVIALAVAYLAAAQPPPPSGLVWTPGGVGDPGIARSRRDEGAGRQACAGVDVMPSREVIVHTCDQGTPEWASLRAGVVTGSCFDSILQPSKLQPAKSSAYFTQIVAERVLGVPCEEEFTSAWTERGKAMEDEARRWYAFERGV